MCETQGEDGILTGFSNKNEKNFPLRTVIIASLAGLSFLLSFLFILSPEASISTPDASEQPAEVLPQPPRIEKHDFKLAGNNTFYQIMSGLNVSGPEILDITEKSRPVYNLRQLRRDSVLSVYTLSGALRKIEYKFSDYEYLVVEKTPQGIKASKAELPHETREAVISGTIENSFYEDALKAGADPQAVMALTDIFAWDIDFSSEIRKGDSFSVLSEVLYVDGVPVRSGKIKGAEMVNGGKKYTAVYYEGKSGSGYYDSDGRSLRRSLLKSPLRFRRITSHFSRGRFHPILKKYRPHHGVDYGAPKGTPVEAAGSGIVKFAGWKGGYGNFVEIKHYNGYLTAYGHLSKIGKGVRRGAKVDQGKVIGYVGSTGISTGPHLHYEMRANGRLINPLSVKTVADKAIPKKEKQAFAAVVAVVREKLTPGGTAYALERPDSTPQVH